MNARERLGVAECDEPTDPGVGSPPNVELPLFVYGLLQPGELAHDHVVGPDARCERATLMGAVLRIRDGLPLLDKQAPPDADVQGHLIWFDEPGSAYKRVGTFEPRRQYRWDVHDVASASGETFSANVLLGRRPSKGSALETADRWQGSLDPVFCFGFPVAATMVQELAEPKFPAAPADSVAMWDRFFRLSSAYLFLWSIVERYTALRFGPGLGAHARVAKLDECSEFRGAVQAVGAISPRPLVDSRNPKRTYRIDSEGLGVAKYWYAVRSNLSHRGKSAFQDGQLLRHCALDLHRTVTQLLPVERSLSVDSVRQHRPQDRTP